jgi:hypothetical protein
MLELATLESHGLHVDLSNLDWEMVSNLNLDFVCFFVPTVQALV